MLPGHDLIVVGAGTAGAHAARRAAEMGLRVLLLERLPKERVGDKVCGEGIALHHLKKAGIPYPEGEELGARINGIDIYPPSMEGYVTVSQRLPGEPCDGWTIDRLLFGQRLLRYALDAGVEFHDQVHVLEPIVEGGFVRGVRYKDKRASEVREARAPLTIDATGMSATLRRRLEHPLVEREVALSDQAVCYREILELKEPPEPADRCIIIMDERYAPGGYIWIFPKGGRVVNVGLGTQGGQGHRPKELFKRFLASRPMFEGAKVISAGGGAAPIRRPLWSYVADGIMFVGDTACQVNPIHGGGIGPGLEAAGVAARVAAEALEQGDTSVAGLWSYNLKYNREGYGRKIASLDLMRHLLQEVGNEEFEFVIRNRIITTEDLLRANAGERLELSALDRAGRLIRGIRRLGLLRRIQQVSQAMGEMLGLYSNFPTPEQFAPWQRQVRQVYQRLGFQQ